MISSKFIKLILVIVAGVFLFAFLYSSIPSNPCYLGDTNIYLSGAESLSTGKGYTSLYYEQAPNITLYPPLNSAYFSLFFKNNIPVQENMHRLHVGSCLLAVLLYGLILFLLNRFSIPIYFSIPSALAFLTSQLFVMYLFGFMSDVLYAIETTALFTLLLFDPELERRSTWIGASLVLAIMLLTRTATLFFLIGWFIYSIVALYKRRYVHCLAGWFAIVVIYFVIAHLHSSNGEYRDVTSQEVSRLGGTQAYLLFTAKQCIYYMQGLPLLDCLSTVAHNLPNLKHLDKGTFHSLAIFIRFMLGTLLSIFLALGFYRYSNTFKSVYIIVAIYIGLVICYPYQLYGRALFPLISVFLLVFLLLLMDIRKKPAGPVYSWMVLLGLVLVIASNSIISRKHQQKWTTPDEIKEFALWVKQHIQPEETIIVTSEIPWIHEFPIYHYYHYSNHALLPMFALKTESQKKAGSNGRFLVVCKRGRQISVAGEWDTIFQSPNGLLELRKRR